MLIYTPSEEKKTVSILYISIAGHNQPVRVADGPITARCRFIKNASWELSPNCFASVLKRLLCFKETISSRRELFCSFRVDPFREEA